MPAIHPSTNLAIVMKTMTTVLGAIATVLLPAPAYELHEWGTFTTVAGSDGVLLTGLDREEEALPRYVHHHPWPGIGTATGRPAIEATIIDGRPVFPGVLSKQIPQPVRNVKVKMETPVIYFHSDTAFKATVKVGFNGGTISQWYPDRSGGEVLPTTDDGAPAILDFAAPYTGAIEWKVDVLSPQDSRDAVLFKPDDLLQWTHARVPEANAVRTRDGETEGFLFYRGLGSFEPGLHTSIDADETLVLRNDTGAAIPYLLVFEKLPDGSTRWRENEDGLAKGDSLRFPKDALEPAPQGFDSGLFREMAGALARQGLHPSEAEAMVKTWWNSYFDKPGLRVFWVLPTARTDAILPLSVDPAPERTIRVLVGRSEVIRPRQERTWLELAGSEETDRKFAWTLLTQNDRFGPAYRERIGVLSKSPVR